MATKVPDGHCYACHTWTPDVYADGCCCCLVHKEHGGKFTSQTVPRKKVE